MGSKVDVGVGAYGSFAVVDLMGWFLAFLSLIDGL